METSVTTLTAWLQYNAEHADGYEVLYQDFPGAYVFKESNGQKHWAPCQRGYAIGRMYYVHPIAGERFYLRLLLTAVAGATSFDHLRAVDGRLCATFREACILLGLVENDREYELCLEEGRVWQTGG